MVEVDQSLLQLQSVSWWRRWSWWGRGFIRFKLEGKVLLVA